MTQRVSQAKRKKHNTWMDTRKKNVSQAASMAFRMSHKYAHMHTHFAAKGYHRTKRAVKAADHSFAAQSWHCHFLLAVPTAAEREREREIRSSTLQTQRCQMFSQPHILCSRHFFASALYGPRVQWSLIYRDLQGLVNYVQNFQVSIVGIFLLFCSQPQGCFTVLFEASNTFGAHCCGKLGKKRST